MAAPVQQHSPPTGTIPRRDFRGYLRELLRPEIERWPHVITPTHGRPFRKYAAIALLWTMVDHVNSRSSLGDVLFVNQLGIPGLPPRRPTVQELGDQVGLERHHAARILDWLVEEGILCKKNHGGLEATVWSFKPLLSRGQLNGT